MTTLMIKDLAVTEELDRSAMSAVRGGTYEGLFLPYGFPYYSHYESNSSFAALQSIGQSQTTINNNGNNAAFVSGITSTVNPTQTANNNINFTKF
jgi:hypothetical protein